MKIPLETLNYFSKPKTPLPQEVGIVEICRLVDLEGNDPRYQRSLAKYSESTALSTLLHFNGDNNDLFEVSNAIHSGLYAISENARRKVLERLDIITYETDFVFNKFEQKVRPLSEDSSVLEELLDATKLLIHPIKKNIKTISELI